MTIPARSLRAESWYRETLPCDGRSEGSATRRSAPISNTDQQYTRGPDKAFPHRLTGSPCGGRLQARKEVRHVVEPERKLYRDVLLRVDVSLQSVIRPRRYV